MVSNCFLGIVPAIIIFSSVYDQKNAKINISSVLINKMLRLKT